MSGGTAPPSADECRRRQKALDEHGGNISHAADALNMPRQTLSAWHQKQVAPDGYKVRGTSTLYGPDGETKLVWVKTREDVERQEQIIHETISALCAEIPTCIRRP